VRVRSTDGEQHQHAHSNGKWARLSGAGGRAMDNEQQQRAWTACGGALGQMASSGGGTLASVGWAQCGGLRGWDVEQWQHVLGPRAATAEANVMDCEWEVGLLEVEDKGILAILKNYWLEKI
jgi:hypothetical protein